jgi:7-carboxy-7-deazaguanine synthase
MKGLTLVNKQKPEQSKYGTGTMLDVIDIWTTIQGEGPYAGTRAVFIRLAGCNLACPMCDTNYTEGRHVLTLNEVEAKVRSLLGNYPTYKERAELVVLTGGEPTRQRIVPLIRKLTDIDLCVQLETNGVTISDEYVYLWQDLGSHLTTVVSPKTPKIDQALGMLGNLHFKYVLDADYVDPVDGLPTHVLGYQHKPARPYAGFTGDVYVQPMDCGPGLEEANARHLAAAVKSCRDHGHRLCLQMHKIANVP